VPRCLTSGKEKQSPEVKSKPRKKNDRGHEASAPHRVRGIGSLTQRKDAKKKEAKSYMKDLREGGKGNTPPSVTDASKGRKEREKKEEEEKISPKT